MSIHNKIICLLLLIITFSSCKTLNLNKVELVLYETGELGIRKDNILEYYSINNNEVKRKGNIQFNLPIGTDEISNGALGPLIIRNDTILKYYKSSKNELIEIQDTKFHLPKNVNQIEMPITGYLMIRINNELRFYNAPKESEFKEDIGFRYTLPAGTDEIAMNGTLLCIRNNSELKFYKVSNKEYNEIKEMRVKFPYKIDEIILSDKRTLVIRTGLILKFYKRPNTLENSFKEIKEMEFKIQQN
jgi:hypothetical protein